MYITINRQLFTKYFAFFFFRFICVLQFSRSALWRATSSLFFEKTLLWKWSHGLWDHFTFFVKKWIWLGNYQSDLRFLGCTPFLWFHVWSSDMIIMHADHSCSSYISIMLHHQIWSWYLIIKVYHHGFYGCILLSNLNIIDYLLHFQEYVIFHIWHHVLSPSVA